MNFTVLQSKPFILVSVVIMYARLDSLLFNRMDCQLFFSSVFCAHVVLSLQPTTLSWSSEDAPSYKHEVKILAIDFVQSCYREAHNILNIVSDFVFALLLGWTYVILAYHVSEQLPYMSSFFFRNLQLSFWINNYNMYPVNPCPVNCYRNCIFRHFMGWN